MIKEIKVITIIILGIIILPTSVLAFDLRGRETVEVAKDEVVEDDLLIAGANVHINGQINGDIKAVGSTVEINGIINGDAVVIGSQVTIRGEITDDLYVVGGQVNLENKIGDNVFISGGSVYISNDSEIGRDLRIYGGTVNINGKIKRNIDGRAEQINITNSVNGYIKGDFDKLIIGPDILVSGDLTYSSPNQAKIDSSSRINGVVNWTKTEIKSTQKNELWNNSLILSIIWKVIKTISLIILGLVLLWLFPKEIRKITNQLADDPGNSILWGLLICITTPIIAVGLLFTVIGIPLSVVAISLYVLALLVAKVVVGLWVGRSMLLSLTRKKKISLNWSMVIGASTIGLLFAIPILGFLTKIVVALFGVGVIFISLRNYFAKRK